MRKPRDWHPYATYHVMQRGVRRMNIFGDEEDYQLFMMLMKKAFKECGYTLHAFCLMTNHYHMLLETSGVEIGVCLRNITQVYAAWFNRKYGYSGHLFEGRFMSVLVKDDAYFLQTSRYIHLNPVKAGMVKRPEEYPWSSYRSITGMSYDGITASDFTKALFDEPSILHYREYVENTVKNQIQQDLEIRNSLEKEEIWIPWKQP